MDTMGTTGTLLLGVVMGAVATVVTYLAWALRAWLLGTRVSRGLRVMTYGGAIAVELHTGRADEVEGDAVAAVGTGVVTWAMTPAQAAHMSADIAARVRAIGAEDH